MKNSVIFLYLLIFNLNVCLAQTNMEDSLVRYIPTLEEDTNKVNALNQLAYVHRTNNLDTSILLVLQSEKLATALNYDKGFARARAIKGIVYSGRGDYSRAFQFILESSEIYEKINNKEGIASNTNLMGVIHGFIKDYDKSIAYYDKARSLYSELKDLSGQRKALNNIGFIYKLRAEYTQSLDYLRRAMEIAGIINDTCKTLYPVYNIGSVYVKLNQLDSAKDYLTRSLNYARKCKDGYVISLALIDLGHMHVANNNLKLAIDSYEEAFDVSESVGLRQEISVSAKALSNLFEQQDDPYKALAYFKIFQRTNDSLFNKENTRRMTLLEAEYKFDKEMREAELKRKVIEFEQERLFSRAIWIRNSFIAGFILMLVISYLFYKNFARKRKANEMLKELNKQIYKQKESLKTHSEELRSSHNRLLQLDEYKEATTAMIIHDFKNSLNTVISFSEGTPTKRRLKSIRQAGQFMLNMVLNMLDVQKYDSAEIKLALGNYPISKVLNEAVNQLSHLIDQKSIKVTHDQSEGTWSRCDYELATRVIVNILTNAIKFVPNNGSIEIITEKDGDVIQLSIKDNGPGIPADKIHLVFDKFSQVNAKKSGSVRSTGIGLTFCKMVVEAHGGEIGVESVEGKGSTFWFTLPKVEAPADDKEEKGNSTLVSHSETTLKLNEKDSAILHQYLLQLQQWEVYDFSEVKAILASIESNDNPAITAWMEEMNKAVQNVNEEMYLNLINKE